MDEILGKIRDWFKNKDTKKLKLDILVIGGLGIILMISGSFFTSGKTKNQSDKVSVQNAETQTARDVKESGSSYEDQLENKLIKILSGVKGIDNVDVMVTLESQEEIVPAINTQESNQVTDEKNPDGGTRTTDHKDITSEVVTAQSNGNNEPVIVKKIYPKIRGVVIAADGADDPQIKYVITKTVQAALDIPIYKIEVLTHN